MTPPPSPELAVLRHLASRTHAGAQEIASALGMPPAQARTFLVVLSSKRLVASRQDPDVRAPRRIYHVTAEGRRRAGISDARQVTLPRDDVRT